MSRMYTIDDIDAEVAGVPELLRSVPRHLTVQFLDHGGHKPHVVLKFHFENIIQIGTTVYKGCILSMDYVGDGPDGLGGELQIKLTTYIGVTFAATAAFQFGIMGPRQPMSVYIDIIRGRTWTSGGDLTRFDFVQAAEIEGVDVLDGCRDFVSQCFVRLHQNQMVTWAATGVVKGDLGQNPRAILPSLGFHDLIGNNYREDRPAGQMMVIPLPLHRGTFFDGPRRVEAYQGYRLPYIP